MNCFSLGTPEGFLTLVPMIAIEVSPFCFRKFTRSAS